MNIDIKDCKVGMEAWLKLGLNRLDRIKILDVFPDDNMVKVEFITSKSQMLGSPKDIRLIRFVDEPTIKSAEPTKKDKVNNLARYNGDIEYIEAMEKIFGSKFTWHLVKESISKWAKKKRKKKRF